MHGVRVLIVEDDLKMASMLRRGLRGDGMTADVAITGEDALWMADSSDYDAIVLDVMLPRMDGFVVCSTLRDRGVSAPVLMLTARDAVDDPSTRTRFRRRRLPDEALFVQRARCPPACTRAPRSDREADGPRRRRPTPGSRRAPRVAR